MTPRAPQGKDTIELIEETVHWLRRAPAGTLLAYYTGSLPFVLGLLYFWSDMSRSPFAEGLLPAAAFGQALLFVWMKTFQAVFARRLFAQMRGEPVPPATARALSQMALGQAILQPSGLFVLALASQILFPFAWTYAFYQNVTALGGDGSSVGTLVRRAWRQALLWPRQNHQLLLVLSFFGFFVFLNLVSAAVAGPFLLKTLLGIETAFTQSAWAILNSTFLAALLALTYLCLDPLVKAAYVLRCFYGESLADGRDLRTDLTRSRTAAPLGALAAALVLLGQVGLGPSARAAASPAATEPSAPWHNATLSPRQLDRAIEEVIQSREYTWRMPRERIDQPGAEKSLVASFFESISTSLEKAMKAVGRGLRKLSDWLNRQAEPNRPGRHRGLDWIGTLQGLVLMLGIALVGLMAWLVVRMWRARRQGLSEETEAEPNRPVPDLTEENLTADRMSEDGWERLAGDLLERGELRLALRALYLSSLAHLANQELITTARFKSNREYERELQRRSHALPALLQAFSENVAAFDRVWYGRHEIDRERLDGFARNVERIKSPR